MHVHLTFRQWHLIRQIQLIVIQGSGKRAHTEDSTICHPAISPYIDICESVLCIGNRHKHNTVRALVVIKRATGIRRRYHNYMFAVYRADAIRKIPELIEFGCDVRPIFCSRWYL